MCGIAGFFGAPDSDLLARMTSAIYHRGPDDHGYFECSEMSIGMRRLSIIDIAGGHQPMSNEDATVQVVYNGEVYNYREVRQELQALGHVFRTESDTEVIVHGYEEWGPQCFSRLNGMWAVAIADLPRKRLVLARDHFGIKPLYYARSGERILFGSEIKALWQDAALKRGVDEQSVYEYLVRGLHDHRRETFFEGILHVPSATYVVVEGGEVIAQERYWQPELGRDGPLSPEAFQDLFRKSVARRLISDVPVGAALSGGLDSSTIVSLMTDLLRSQLPDAQSLRGRVKTFSAVFDNDPIDEREYIETEVAATGADTLYTRPLSQEFIKEMGELVWYLDEPVVSTGPYAQWCVMRTARTQVKVVLDGQGGDELLAGYVPYQMVYLRQLWRERRLGLLLREGFAARDVLWPLVRRNLGRRRRGLPLGSILRKEFTSKRQSPLDTRPADNLKERLLQDVTVYSLPALLRYEDRNSMAHSIESRVPYLDQELVSAILRLPESQIIRDGWSRILLRESMRGLLPDKIRLRRWKVGFTTPESRWLFARRAVFEGLFRSPMFHLRPYWNGAAVATAFRQAAQGKLESSLFFWRVINLELWLRVYFEGGAPIGEERRDFTRVGDEQFARRAGPTAQELCGRYRPNAGRHLFAVADGGRAYLRAPVRTPLVQPRDDLQRILEESLRGQLQPGDVIAISEKIVAISQGRSFPVSEIQPRPLARFLTRYVHKTAHGIGLGIPETMELAIREVGAARILFAAAAAAIARPFGRKGVFYEVLGTRASAIDGPTSGTIPPYNGHAKLAPENPHGVAKDLAAALGDGIGVAIVDANDISVNVLGQSPGVDSELVRQLLLDNPLGQGHEQTPIAILREVANVAEIA
ncbi:MAG: asparagine synthase (glutamine-hydrolyzing) [Thermaerobacter sp.]|nr:asparagine synthase (glutamine-hydrolyzing) [Thermaerobacter sp.]